jgi:hypothetical protein
VTSTLPQGTGSSLARPPRPLRAFAATRALVALLLGGLALRLTIAYALFPSWGFWGDINAFGSWSIGMGRYGAVGFYENIGSDYLPGALLALWPGGLLARAVTETPGAANEMATDLVKLPPILVDIAVAYVIYRLVVGWSWPGRRAETMGLVAAALYVFNPVTIYDSAVWGQQESFGALVLLLGVAALVRGNSEGAAMVAVLAALVKPQFGTVLLPLVGGVLLTRHLFRSGSGPRHTPWGPPRVRVWLRGHQGWVRLVTAGLASATVFFAVALPFGLGPIGLMQRLQSSAGSFESLSANAYNAWAFFQTDGPRPLVDGLGRNSDTVAFLGPAPAVVVGAALLAIGYVWTVWRAADRDDRWTLLVAAAVLSILFFALPTRVHERYLVPVFAILPILVVAQRRWAIVFGLLALATLANLHGILATGPLPLGAFARSPEVVIVAALVVTGVALWAALRLRPSVSSSPDGFAAAADMAPAADPKR